MGGGGHFELFMCPYRLKIQARPPQDQRLATQSRVLGQNMFVYICICARLMDLIRKNE